jgi:hypothetical protein
LIILLDDLHCANWFDSMMITCFDNDETEPCRPVVNQAVLHGMLNHIRDLGLPLLAVDRVAPGDEGAAQIDPPVKH